MNNKMRSQTSSGGGLVLGSLALSGSLGMGVIVASVERDSVGLKWEAFLESPLRIHLGFSGVSY